MGGLINSQYPACLGIPILFSQAIEKRAANGGLYLIPTVRRHRNDLIRHLQGFQCGLALVGICPVFGEHPSILLLLRWRELNIKGPLEKDGNLLYHLAGEGRAARRENASLSLKGNTSPAKCDEDKDAEVRSELNPLYGLHECLSVAVAMVT
jgi:hypothetical protein